ncbi:ABC transporter substrate-binding protein [Deferrisoma palaeochoriense]
MRGVRLGLVLAAAAWFGGCASPAVRPEPPVPPVEAHRKVFAAPPAPKPLPPRPAPAPAPEEPPRAPVQPEQAEAAPPPPETTADPLALAREFVERGEFAQARAILAGAESTPEARRLLGDVLVALGRYPEAVAAYAEAIPEDDDIAAEPIRQAIRGVLDAMGPEDLKRVAAWCLFCPEGGYARLRLARLALERGAEDEALALLGEIEADFAGDLLGRSAGALRRNIEARRAVRPGTIGLLVPLSGPLRSFGQRAVRGAVLGAGLFGDEDPGNRIVLKDSRADPNEARIQVEALAAEGAVAAVGPLKGDAAAAAAAAARGLGLPLVTLTPAEGVAGDGVFRMYLPEAEEVRALVRYAVAGLGLRTFAILYPDTPTGRLYRDRFWDAVVAEGGEITGVEAFAEDLASAGAAVEKLTGVYGLTPEEIRARFLEEERLRLERERALWEALGVTPAEAALEPQVDEERLAEYKPKPIVDFDAVFLPAPSLTAAQVAPLLAFHDVESVRLLGIRSWIYPKFLEVGKDAVEGAVFAAAFHPSRPESAAFSSAFETAYGEPPDDLAAYAHDAVKAVVSAGPEATRPDVRALLASLRDLPGALGPVSASPGGDLHAAPVLLAVRRGRFEPIGDLPPPPTPRVP